MSDDLARFRADLTRHLDWFAARGRKVRFWWRDDDAIAPTPALDRLLALANRNRVDVVLAVIPKDTSADLAKRLASEPHAVVVQHGWQHRNFQLKARDEKSAELGNRRDPDAVLAELSAGKARLETLFGHRFLPVLVPPWNRITPALSRRLPEIGLTGLSSFTWHYQPRPGSGLTQVQSHVDMIAWRDNGRFVGWRKAHMLLDLQLARRRTNPAEPIGILSHHLVQTDDSFDFLAEVLAIAAHHPGADWPKPADLFADTAPSASRQ